jgi:hypothetical protein
MRTIDESKAVLEQTQRGLNDAAETQHDIAMAVEWGRQMGECIKAGDLSHAGELLKLWNKRGEIKAKLFLLGWQLHGVYWYHPAKLAYKPNDLHPPYGLVFHEAALAADVVTRDEFHLLSAIYTAVVNRWRN